MTVATHDMLADALLARYRGLVDRIEVSIPLTGPADEEMLRTTIARLRAG